MKLAPHLSLDLGNIALLPPVQVGRDIILDLQPAGIKQMLGSQVFFGSRNETMVHTCVLIGLLQFKE